MVERYKDKYMQEVIKRSIRSAMINEGLSYTKLSERLESQGVHQTASTLRTKVSTGLMTTSLYIHILSVLKVNSINVTEMKERCDELRNKV